MTCASISHDRFGGIYTLPDAARILRLPLPKLRRWLQAKDITDMSPKNDQTLFGLSLAGVTGKGLERNINFWSMVELFTIYQLRNQGISFSRIRRDREELLERYHCDYPFALQGFVTDGKQIGLELTDESLLILGDQGQTLLNKLVTDFFQKVDFDASTRLARRYFPVGRDKPIVVDPRISFGRPTVKGTAIATETLKSLFNGGDDVSFIAAQFELDDQVVEDAILFESNQAAA